jgi:putative glutamine amidotransferase
VRPNEDELSDFLTFVDGILLVGGCDIDPKQYHEQNMGQSKEIDGGRDSVELSVVKHAREQNLPLLGICRGMQIINVAFGGSLYQDLATAMPGAVAHYFYKDENGNLIPRDHRAHHVTITEETLLYRTVNTATIEVNSLHHKGVCQPGTGLRVSAHAPDGLIEAIELPDHPFLLGVEWHPEELVDEPSRKIFSAFIAAAQERN